MNVISVGTATPYDIYQQRGILAGAGDYCRRVNRGDRALIVTDSNVGPLYAQTAVDSLTAAGYQTEVFTFEAGEQSKTLATVEAIYDRLAAASFSRADLLVALGGGVTGDMTGFAAATWMRGIDFVQIPTSLLAQVDSSVGGKTGVDIPSGKNLIGAFWQPRLVLLDADVLQTLKPAVFADGMAEVIKTACIKDAALFERLAADAAHDPDQIESVIAACVSIKRDVVERDERESGERKLLNFGHTLGHALEKYYHYTALSHGSAVAVGMCILSAAAERAGLTAAGTTARIAQVLQQYHLPTADPAAPCDYLSAVLHDKKRVGTAIDLVLLEQIGVGFVHRMPVDEVERFVTGAYAV